MSVLFRSGFSGTGSSNHRRAPACQPSEVPVHSDAIVGVSFEGEHPLWSMLCDDGPGDQSTDAQISRRLFQIRMADSAGRRSDASILINRMYATRGYHSAGLPERAQPNRITLVASEHDSTIGTITIGFDSPAGLLVEELFATETQELRQAGRTVCEFTKLAMDSVVRSTRVLATLFHVAFIYSHRIMSASDLLIEVNPRHTAYYKRMLGFEVIAPARLNQRVNAPAVLMRLDFAHARAQIIKCGGTLRPVGPARSLYPYFFSTAEETGIAGRLQGATSPREFMPPQSHAPSYGGGYRL